MYSVEFKLPADKAHRASAVQEAITSALIPVSIEAGLITVSTPIGDSVYPVCVYGANLDELEFADQMKKLAHSAGTKALGGERA